MVRFIDLGTIGFSTAFQLQAERVRDIAEGNTGETVYLLEHTHVFTLGRRGSEQNLLRSRDDDGEPIELVRINRGGDITYHGPGQLVVYPLLDLRKRGLDLGRYLRDLEGCVINAVGRFGVDGYRRSGLTGVWTDQGKLASIGVGVRRWISMHGLALNVSTDLSYFESINPCGMAECPVTSLENLLDRTVPIKAVKKVMKDEIRRIFVSPDS